MAEQESRETTREEILELIEECKRSGGEELKLSGRPIFELPDEIGHLTHLTKLDISAMGLRSLPDSIGSLINLRVLNVRDNELASLPDSTGNLTNLWWLNVKGNKLASLPCSTGNLTNIQVLELMGNQLTSLPDRFGNFTQLFHLDLDDNNFASLPEQIVNLEALVNLYLRNNHLEFLTESIGKLKLLQLLDIRNNRLTSLPISLTQMDELNTLRLDGNPLTPALQSAYEAGLPELRAYLRSLGEPGRREELYEAKLVLVGEGSVGKTTLLKALTGREPKKGEPTTHGVEINVEAMHLPHPEKPGTQIQLNAWDFGGQEVYRVTHQFFFSSRSIYLVVWEPRMGVQQCQVEDWLRMIRLRVGDAARVIIVSTHCRTGERIARIDKPVFMRDFGPMIVGFHEVDSLEDDPNTGEKVGIARLREMIAEAAGGLEQMGMEFNRDWREARDELLATGQPRISYNEFVEVCGRHGLNDVASKTLARLMHDLGYIVYYGDDERLQSDVVLQPEWLTKAIGFVLEDRATQEADGILPDERLKEVWWSHRFANEPRFEPEFYPFFLRLMEKYDVLYRLEGEQASLVAQHVSQVRPELPWLPEEDPAPERRRTALVCVMEESPPGLVPWMIVRTHHYAYESPAEAGRARRLQWQKGMFVRNRGHGEALLELREREFHIYAEAVWPEFFTNVLRQTLQKLITDNWPGMEGRYFFGVPCRGHVAGKPCDSHFRIDALRQFLEEGDETIRCQSCRTRQNIVELLYGLEEENLREQLEGIKTGLEQGFAEVREGLKGLESRLANYVMAVLQAIASESKDGPRLFTIEPLGGKLRRLFSTHYRLRLWCEAEGCQHPVFEEDKGTYEFEETQPWVRQMAPYANFIVGVLKTLVPVVAPAVNLYFGQKVVEQMNVKDHLDIMKELTGKLAGELAVYDRASLRQGVLSEAERSGVLALHAFLREADPNHDRLGLRRVPTYTGDFRWLCQTHYENTQSDIPEVIE